MEEQKIFEEFKNILRAYTKDPALLDKATKETHILKDLKVNSARLVDIVLEIEDAFGIAVKDEEADQVKTVGDAVNLILKSKG